ncbi:response regulator [Pseudodesulfovibrio senegalensis]|jgi:putative nucleotidyltransferase with HDIG domain|nr:response regulator [Pseudodesulfovibrio senegalensis]
MSDRPHLLFVDDDPKVISGIRRNLHPYKKEWKLSFAGSGQEALELIKSEKVDLLVSDIRMPGMTGQELFDHVQRISPQTIRMALSGIMEVDNVVETMGNAHRFMSKPCSPEKLTHEIEEALAAREDHPSPDTQKLATRLGSLPVLPEVYQRIEDELSAKEPSMHRMADIVSQDPGLVAAVLKLTNSPFFGLRRTITSIFQAINLLGMETVKALIVSQHIFWGQSRKNPPFSIKLLWEHSFRVSNMARLIAQCEQMDRNAMAQCRIGGILHDIGKLILADSFDSKYEAVVQQSGKGTPIHEKEKELFNVNHAQIGMYVMDLWGMDPEIAKAIGHHHDTLRPDISLSLIIAVADHFDHAWINFTNDYTGAMISEPLYDTLRDSGDLERWETHILDNWPEIREIGGFKEGNGE